MKERKNDFSQGSIARSILALAVPMTVAQLTVVLYNVVDRMFIGHIPDVGRDALTGIGLVMPVVYIITAFSNLSGMGGAPLFSIARGHGDDQEAQRIMGNAFVYLLVLGAALMAVFYLFLDPILYLVGGSDATVVYGRQYLLIYLIGTIPVMLSLGMNPFINAQGFGRTGMMTVLLGAVLNTILDPIFIFLFHMGSPSSAPRFGSSASSRGRRPSFPSPAGVSGFTCPSSAASPPWASQALPSPSPTAWSRVPATPCCSTTASSTAGRPWGICTSAP